MANRNLFQTMLPSHPPVADRVNDAGGKSYSLPPREALAQLANTGCFNGTWYQSAEVQMAQVLELCSRVEPRFVAQLAVHARQRGRMKDMPAVLCAYLSVADGGLLEQVFSKVIDSPRMLSTFVQVMRSGAVGRKSLGTRPRRLVRQWLQCRSAESLFRASAGLTPSIADIVRMVHPCPSTPEHEALFGYLIGRRHSTSHLPALVREYIEFKESLASSSLEDES